MSTTEEEVRIPSPFGGSVASDERELPIDEGVTGTSAVSNLQTFPNLNVVISEGEECVRRALAEVEKVLVRPKKQAKEIVLWTAWAAWKKKLDMNQKDLDSRTFCNALICCQRLCWRV